MTTIEINEFHKHKMNMPFEVKLNATFSSENSGSSAFECRGFVYADLESGGYCAFAIRLPGVYGEGDTVEEAFADLCESFALAIEVYRDTGKPIPWRDTKVGCDKTGTELWAIVHVGKAASD